jgi:bifunctional DNase/RNase
LLKPAKIYSLIFIPPLAQYVVTLEEVDGTRLVPIWIGITEGNAIAMVLQGEKFHRPLTHDLIANILKDVGATIEKIVISDLKENAYYATITIKQNGKTYEIDSRPSDAMALVVRTNSPIFIDEKVLKLCPVINKPITEEEVKKFKEELKSLRPEDFFKRLDEEGGKAEGGIE